MGQNFRDVKVYPAHPLGHRSMEALDWIRVGLLMGRIIFGVFGLGCYVELFGWEVMGLQDKWVEMEWVC